MINIKITTIFFEWNVMEHYISLGNEILLYSLSDDSFALFSLP